MCMEQTDDAKSWFDKLDIGQVIDMFKRAGVGSIWVKRLGINNNSKQQVYIAGDPSDLSFMPLGNPTYSAPKSQKKKAGSPVFRFLCLGNGLRHKVCMKRRSQSSAIIRSTLKCGFLDF